MGKGGWTMIIVSDFGAASRVVHLTMMRHPMKRLCVALACIVLSASTAQAQFFFNPFRKAAPSAPPAERVAQLVNTLKTDPDERKRLTAVEDLREFDVKAFPQILDVLVDVARSDAKASVRGEAVSSLVRIRPVSAAAGQAIEHAASKDENWRNRMNAQAALVRYRFAGYSSGSSRNDNASNPPAPPQSGEPPLNDAASDNRRPIIYHDQNGKVIPAPPGFPTHSPIQPPVTGTPTSNPGTGSRSPFAPIGSAPTQPSAAPRPIAPQVAPGTIMPQPQQVAPPPIAPQQAAPQGIVPPPFPQGIAPQPIVPQPAPPQPIAPPAAFGTPPVAPPPATPPAIEPTFRNLNRITPPPLTLTPPTNPTPAPAVLVPQGPSLDLPPLPINGNPPPAVGPALDSTDAQPAGQMEPSPRLRPVSN